MKKKNPNQKFVIPALIVLVVLGAYFGMNNHGPKEVAPGLSGDEVVIGLVGPMTGNLATFGEQVKRAGEQFVQDINAAGGIHGHPVRIELADDACDPKQAVAAAGQLLNKKPVIVVGHVCSSAAIPASSVYAENNIPFITSGASNPLLTERGLKGVYRFYGRDDQQAVAAADYIIAHFAGKKIALVHDKSSFGQSYVELAQKRLHEKGVQEAMFEAITAGEKDYSALITKLKSAGVDVVIYGGYHTEGGLIVRQAHEQGLSMTMLGGDAFATEEFWSITGPAGEGTLFTFAPDPRLNPTAKNLVESFRNNDFEPESFTLFTYGALQAAAGALTNAASFEGDAVNQVLHSATFDTIMGPTTFGEKGDNSAISFVVYAWHDGAYAQVDKPVAVTTPEQGTNP